MQSLFTVIALACLLVWHAPTFASSRVALIIGNSDYQWSPLENPKNDANDMANTLRDLGFEVSIQTDARRVAMHRAIREFGKKLAGAEIGLFYYAGHGVQVGGRNYLVPTDADIREEDEVAFETIDAAQILEKMESAQNPVNIVILDACRNNPFASNARTTSRGLARMDSPVGSLLLYATAPNKTAADGEGRNGVLTGNLIKHLSEPGLPLNEIILRTRVGVMEETNDMQVPWSASSLTRNVVLNQHASLDNSQISVTDKTSVSASHNNSEKLMRICNKHFKANRLTSGTGGSALACYQQVLESDPFNLEALEGIENVANKYHLRAENAVKAKRYASAERHLHNLKLVSPEHLGVEEIEYALKVAFSNASPAGPATSNTPKAPRLTVSAPLPPAETTVNPVSTETQATQIAQPNTVNITTTTTGTNNIQVASVKVTPSFVVQPKQETKAVLQSKTSGLSINSDASKDANAAISKALNTTASFVKNAASESASSPKKVSGETAAEEVKLAFAKTTNGQPYQLCPNCMQPASTAGQPCIQHEVLKGEFVPAGTNLCHTKIGNKCMDVVYRFRLNNVCQSDMYVEWVFSTFSGDALVGKRKVAIGSTAEVTCLNKEQGCKGQIRYGWDSVAR